MIQRIQTVFLLIATILMAFVAFMPFAEVATTAELAIYELGFKGLVGSNVPAPEFNTIPMSILITLCIGLCVATILLYKNRMLQIRLSVVNIVLLLGLMGLMYYYVRTAQSIVDGTSSYSIIFMFPLAAAILVFLALRAIARDEALVRSLDRLR